MDSRFWLLAAVLAALPAHAEDVPFAGHVLDVDASQEQRTILRMTGTRYGINGSTAQTGIAHACEGETSIWLHLDPSQVRLDQIAQSVSPNAPAANAAITRFWSFSERAPVTGVRGDARAATPDKGRAIFDAMAEGLAKELRDTANWTAPDDVWARGRAQGSR